MWKVKSIWGDRGLEYVRQQIMTDHGCNFYEEMQRKASNTGKDIELARDQSRDYLRKEDVGENWLAFDSYWAERIK